MCREMTGKLGTGALIVDLTKEKERKIHKVLKRETAEGKTLGFSF